MGTKILLAGMPGCGKSTLGKELASKMQLEFIDLDEELEKSSGKTIRGIFAISGEDTFRVLEKKQLRQAAHEARTFIMAVGGGTPCFFDNMEVMKTSGLVVFLDVSAKVLSKRLTDEGIEKRPLLHAVTEGSITKALIGELHRRLPFYSQAHITVKGDDISVADIADALENHQRLLR